MAGSGIQLTGPWKALQAGLNPGRFKQLMEKNVGLATRQNALVVQKEIQGTIKGGVNPGITELSELHHKGSGQVSDKPLVDEGSLWMSVNTKVISWREAFAGIIKGQDQYDIGVVLHEGVSIRVTERMRAYFRYLAQETGGAIKPLLDTTTVIVIPPRPFVKLAYTPAVSKDLQKRWQMAMQQTMREMVR
jgi:hypothetical protein